MIPEKQNLTANEIEQAKTMAVAIWPDIDMASVTVEIMPMPQAGSYKWGSEQQGVNVDSVDVRFFQDYSFAFHPLLYRLWIGKKENHGRIPDWDHM